MKIPNVRAYPTISMSRNSDFWRLRVTSDTCPLWIRMACQETVTFHRRATIGGPSRSNAICKVIGSPPDIPSTPFSEWKSMSMGFEKPVFTDIDFHSENGVD